MRLLSRMGKGRFRRLAVALAVIGPGVITANVDNDAGGIATYSLAGGNYGYTHLWALIPVGVLLFVIQEMAARLGAATGKGLQDLIRERFGLRLTFWLLLGLLITNLANTLAEFAGIASAAELFSVPRYVAVPVAAVIVWLVVTRANYATVEKVFLVACVFYVAYPISGLLTRPDWEEIGAALVRPRWSSEPGYVTMLIGIVGTTIAPWMQFYQQAAVADKGLSIKDYRLIRLDTLVGCVVAVVVVFFIVVTCAATIHASGLRVSDAESAAQALRPLAGPYCAWLFAFGLLNASLFAACILPLATAYQLCEGMGWERGVDHRFGEAPEFYSIFTFMVVLGAGVVMVPQAPLFQIMYLSQVLNGIVLPVVLVLMLILINSKSIMGTHTNRRTGNLLASACVIAVSGLVIYMAVATLLGAGG